MFDHSLTSGQMFRAVRDVRCLTLPAKPTTVAWFTQCVAVHAWCLFLFAMSQRLRVVPIHSLFEIGSLAYVLRSCRFISCTSSSTLPMAAFWGSLIGLVTADSDRDSSSVKHQTTILCVVGAEVAFSWMWLHPLVCSSILIERAHR